MKDLRRGTEKTMEKAREHISANLAKYDVPINQIDLLPALIDMLAENLLVSKAIVPPSWNKVIKCKHCGEVPSDINSDSEFLSCPWCFLNKG